MNSSSAVATLYADHHGWLQNWIQRRLRSPDRAADLAQATFCRLLEHDDVTVPESPRSFLATVAKRLLIDDVRRRDIERAYIECYSTLHGESDTLTPERIVEASRLLQGIVELLSTMPAAVRKAFVLRRIDGFDHDAIARMLGVSTRTVKRHVAQAYVHLYSHAFPS